MDWFRSESFDTRVKKLMEEWHVPGLSIAVLDGESTNSKAFGFVALDSKLPATPETIYDCASTSKSFVAASIAKLVSDNEAYPQVDWDTHVSKLLPDEFILSDIYASEHATIEDLLCHRTGLPRHDSSYVGVRAKQPDTPESMTNSLRHLPMTASLGKEFQYNNIMYTVAVYLLEKVTRQTWAEFLQARILGPLDMTSTCVQPSAVYKAGKGDYLARPLVWLKDKEIYKEIGIFEQPEGEGAGSVHSTVLDYAKWIRAFMTKEEELFTNKIYDELTRPRIISDDDCKPFTSTCTYALGWEVEFYRGYRVISHSGGVAGYGSQMMFIPDLQFGLVIFGNASGSNALAIALQMELVDKRLGVPETERVDWNEREREQEEQWIEKNKNSARKIREDILERSGTKETGNVRRLLSSYCGTYYNAGYHDLKVTIGGDGRLHVDGNDRTYPFQLSFEHICGDEFVVDIHYEDEELTVSVRGCFRVDADGDMASSVGICFEEAMGDELIWFDRLTLPAE